MLIQPQGTMTHIPHVHGNIYVVGEAPGREEHDTGIPFMGSSGKILMQLLAHNNVTRNHIRIANTYWKQPPGNNLSRISTEEKHHFVELLHEDILKQRPKPDVILALGNTAWKALTAPLDATLSDMRGTYAPYLCEPSIPVLPTYHPAAILRQWEWHHILHLDIKKAVRGSLGRAAPPIENFIPNATASDFISFMRDIPAGAPVAFDIETLPKQHVVTHLGLASNASDAACFQMLRWSTSDVAMVLEQLEAFTQCHQIICQNAPYEMTWGKLIFGTNWHVTWDTMLMHHDIFPEGRKGLGYLASIYLDLPAWKYLAGEDKAVYNCRDCTTTFMLWQELLRQFSKEDRERYLTITHPQVTPVSQLACRGLKVDQEALVKLRSSVIEKMEALEHLLSQFEVKLSSPKQIAELLYGKFRLTAQYKKDGKGARKRTADEGACKKLLRNSYGDARFFLTHYMKWKKLSSELTKELNLKPHPITDAIHTCYGIAGTETHRYNSTKVAW